MCGSAVNDWVTAIALGSARDTTQPNDSATNHQPASSPLANHVDNRQDANGGTVVLTVMRSGVKAPGGEAVWLESRMNQVYQTQMCNYSLIYDMPVI